MIFNLFYGGKGPGEAGYDDNKGAEIVPPVTEETPCFKDIYIKNVVCNGAGRAVYFNGLPEMRISNINMENMIVTNANRGVELSQADGVNINNVKVSLKGEGKTLKMQNVANVTIDGKKYENVANEAQELDL